MTWTAVGSFGDQQAATFSLTPSAIGNLIILDVANFSNSTVFASSVSSSNVTWTPVGHYLGVTNTGTHTLFLGQVTGTGAATVTPTWSGTAPAGIQFDYHEFHTTLGAWSVDTFTHLDSAGTTTWASLTPAISGELYWGFAFDATSAAGGTTSGYVYNVGGTTGNGQAYNLNCTGGVATAPVWGDGNQQLGMMMLVQENAPATYPPVSAPRAYPPGWFPGCDGLGGPPCTVPFTTPAQPAYGILPPPPVPPPPAAQQRPVPPGWFPGCDAVTAAPGGVPFYMQPLPAASPPKPYIVGLSPGTFGVNRWFVDQYGNPRVFLAGEDWGLPANAGSAGTGTWQQDYQNYLSIRAAQGYTVATLDPYGNSIHHGNDNGNTLDGVAPFTTPFNVFNETFWQRIDYLIALAATYGITINLDIAYSYDFGTLGGTGTGTLFNTMTLTQATAYGVALGNRYKNSPNLLWMFGDDDFNNATLDGLFTNIAAGIRSTGDTHEMSIEYYPSGTTSHRDLSAPTGGTPFNFGTNYATYNWVYYYWTSYFGVEGAYADPTAPLPVVWGDGYFYDDAGAEPPVVHANQQLQRNMVWWALSSGARGVTGGSEQIFPWWSAAASGVSTSSLDSLRNEAWAAKQAFVVRQLLESLPNWYKLAPDVHNTLVISGRGTHSAYNTGHFLAGNSPDGYVTASYVSDGSLAIIYCDAAFSITINQAVMTPGYTATWVDPSNGAQTPTATGSSYSSSGLGANSVGDADWLLVLVSSSTTLSVPTSRSARLVVPTAIPHAMRAALPPPAASSLSVSPPLSTLSQHLRGAPLSRASRSVNVPLRAPVSGQTAKQRSVPVPAHRASTRVPPGALQLSKTGQPIQGKTRTSWLWPPKARSSVSSPSKAVPIANPARARWSMLLKKQTARRPTTTTLAGAAKPTRLAWLPVRHSTGKPQAGTVIPPPPVPSTGTPQRARWNLLRLFGREAYTPLVPPAPPAVKTLSSVLQRPRWAWLAKSTRSAKIPTLPTPVTGKPARVSGYLTKPAHSVRVYARSIPVATVKVARAPVQLVRSRANRIHVPSVRSTPVAKFSPRAIWPRKSKPATPPYVPPPYIPPKVPSQGGHRNRTHWWDLFRPRTRRLNIAPPQPNYLITDLDCTIQSIGQLDATVVNIGQLDVSITNIGQLDLTITGLGQPD